ncbi:unnamed protein product [Peniophora sp. CBMAI 1063]|nr:unnamed protein product [Peniophora sp. CBMAI 1063]
MVATSSNETQPTQMLQNILGGPRVPSTTSNAGSPFARRVSPRQAAPTASVYVSDETQGVYESQIGDEDTQSQKENAPKRRTLTLPNTRSRPISPIKPPPRGKRNKPSTPQADKSVEDHSLPPPPVSRGRSELSVMDQLVLSPNAPDESMLLSQGDDWDQPHQSPVPVPSPVTRLSPPRVSSPPIVLSSQSQSQDFQATQPLSARPELPQPPPAPQPVPMHAPGLDRYRAQRKQRHDAVFPKFAPLAASPVGDETQLGGSDGNTQPAIGFQYSDAGSTQLLGGDGATQQLGETQPLEEETQPATQPYSVAPDDDERQAKERDVLDLWNHIQSRHGTGQSAAEDTQPLEDDILNATPGQIPGLGSTQVRAEGETQMEETQVDPVPSSRITSVRDPGLELFNLQTRAASAGPSTQRTNDVAPRQRNASGPMPMRDLGLELLNSINESKKQRSAPPSARTEAEMEPESMNSDETRATHGGSSPQRGRRDSGESDIVPDSLAGSLPAPATSSNERPKRTMPTLISPDSESEDDVPLSKQVAAKSRSASPPNKRRRVESLPAVPEDKSLSMSGIRAQQKGKGREEDDGDEVPSSVPHEDKDQTPAPSRLSSKNKGKGKAKARSTSRSTTRTTRSKSVTPAPTSDGYDAIFVGSLSPLGPSQDPIDLIPKTEKGQPMEVDEEEEDVKPQISANSRKRKRSNAPAARNTRAKSARVPSGTPKAGPSRLRGTVSTGRRHASGEATRVFALWKATGSYFPGTVRSQEGSSYWIDFDDGTDALVPLECLRRLALQPGDKVTFSEATAVVVAALGSDKDAAVSVKFVTGQDKDEKEDTTVGCLEIPSRTISAQWRERTLSAEDIVPSVRPHGVQDTPTPSRASTLNNTDHLSGIAFVITLSTTTNRDQVFTDTKKIVTRHGGKLLDEWSDLYHIPCAPESGSGRSAGRWTWDPAKFEFKPKVAARGVEKVFLISDEPSHKIKYMMALAWGVPCLSIDAIKDPEFNQVWHRYLLPAGFSTKLNAKVSQLIDYDWGADTTHMSDVMNASVVQTPTVALRPFKGKRMLLVGAEFVKTGRKTSGNASEEYGMPEILLCAGAARVVSVKDVPAQVNGFDFIVLKDTAGYDNDDRDVPFVSTAWVKDCIISGRLHAP